MKKWIRLGQDVEDWFNKLPYATKKEIMGQELPAGTISGFFRKKSVHFQIKAYLKYKSMEEK